jgi:hypothetical protein
MPHIIERASSGRAKCRGCGEKIAAGEQRLGERLPNAYANEDGLETTHWFHLTCAAFRRPEPLLEALSASADVVDDRATLEREARLGVMHPRAQRVNSAERAASARAACRGCREKIDKGAWRIALVYYEDGRFTPGGFVHLHCAAAYFETPAILVRLRHFSPALTDVDRADIEAGLATSRQADQ